MHGDMVPGLRVMDEKAIIVDIVLFLLCLVAVVSNGLIMAALGVQWLLRRALSPCDKLLISLGASRFCLQWVAIGERIYVLLCPKATPYNPVLQFLAFQWDFLNTATFWFSSWLSVFYCLKIATLTHPVFLRLKRKVSGLVPWMLLSSVGLSTLTTILFFIGNQSIYQKYFRRGLQSWNVTEDTIRRTYEKFYFFPLKIVTWTVPTIVFLSAMVLLITSLGRHAKKTFLSMSGSHNPGAQVHIKALLVLISFAILFTSSFLSLVLSSSGVFPSEELKWSVAAYLCAAVHPIILLVSNPRLRAVLGRGRARRGGGILTCKR